MPLAKPSVLLIEARYYLDISDELAKGAIAALEEAGASYHRVAVPGALEIPQALAFAVRAGLIPFGASRWRYHGAVALGCVIRGETSHYDIVANESARSLLGIATGSSIPMGNGILTVENESQAWERASITDGNKGADAAVACLRLIDVFMDCHGFQSE
ncbi:MULTISPECIES: 6,7-dimethyl-8-ribityllumazine synthase [Rhodomicrobium]|uniref:6,7-dimethyl-8-ribityllumazine synthase n=1 Tax=Rhodomicrobium TaxID=1068 RepID=UPI000B4B0212|nr:MULTISPECIES: 6,7-dimethyl-8-ribityllumazine synthase [Rhodomicrobium]